MTAAELAVLPSWAFAFALVLCRCSAAVMLLPALGEVEIPMTVRAGLSVALVALILPAVGTVPAPNGWHTAGMIGAELLCGGVLGWLARCITLALPMAGQIISFMLGLSSIITPDPVLGQSSTMMRLFSLACPVLVLGSGLWALPVEALAGSYNLVPPGSLLSLPDSAQAVVGAVGTAFGLALRLAFRVGCDCTAYPATTGLFCRDARPNSCRIGAAFTYCHFIGADLAGNRAR